MKGYRTIAFNTIMLVVSIFGISEVSPEQITAAVTAGAGIWTLGNVILRAITNSPMFKAE